jgi:hypothetical protein
VLGHGVEHPMGLGSAMGASASPTTSTIDPRPSLAAATAARSAASSPTRSSSVTMRISFRQQARTPPAHPLTGDEIRHARMSWRTGSGSPT